MNRDVRTQRFIGKAKRRSIAVTLVLVLGFGIGMDAAFGSPLTYALLMVFGHSEETKFARPVAVAAVMPSLSVEQLEAKLDEIVWGIESDRHVMEEGEIFMTFDPPQSWPLEKCLKVGGKANDECYSHGPRQEKISLIQTNWPTLHSGEKITEKGARDVAEGNDSSRQFFLQCSEYVKGCAVKWTSATVPTKDGERVVKPEVQIYIDLIREAKGIVL